MPPQAHFHITYKKNGRTETGRVVLTDSLTESAALKRAKAIQAAAWKYGCAPRTVSVVRVYPKADA